jgi:thiol-disulfide isomerase/thioredoxin
MYKKMILLIAIVQLLGSAYGQEIATTESILVAAKKQAKKQNKNIFIKFSASWCGWCHKMDAAIHDSSTIKLFEANYVIKQIIVQENAKNKAKENAGGEAFMQKVGGTNQGLPYWVVLDADGKLLANSKLKQEGSPLDGDGSNVGCPAEEEEINYLLNVLKATSKLDAAALGIIKKRFALIK